MRTDDAISKQAYTLEGDEPVSVEGIAIAHRNLMLSVLALVLCVILAGASLYTDIPIAPIVLMGLCVPLYLRILWWLYRLTLRCGESIPSASILIFTAIVFPPAGLFWFWITCSQATLIMGEVGVRPGTLGLRRRDLYKLYENLCTHCGYSMRGLGERKCPECGNPHESPTSRDTHAPASPV